MLDQIRIALSKIFRTKYCQSIAFWALSISCRSSKWLAVTYDNEQHTDGAGSQLHRIYGIYAFRDYSKFLISIHLSGNSITKV